MDGKNDIVIKVIDSRISILNSYNFAKELQKVI